MSKHILHSFSIGKRAENLVVDILIQNGFDASIHDLTQHDINLTIDNKIYRCEVKYDIKALKTKNLAIETHNTKQDKPSGIFAESDLLFYVLSDNSIFVTTTKKIRNFIVVNPPDRIVEYAGDGNARIYLYTLTQILPQVFYKLLPNKIHEIMDKLIHEL